MSRVVQAKCPGCQNMLRIPADWLSETIRCKRCGKVCKARTKPRPVQANGLASEPMAAGVQANGHGPGHAEPASVMPRAYTAAPQAPVAMPVATPVQNQGYGGDHDQSFGSFGNGDGEGEGALISTKFKRRRRSSGLKVAMILLVLVGGGAGAAYYFRDKLPNIIGSNSSTENKKPTKTSPALKPKDLPPLTGDFPRRMLAISVNNYWYFNPVSYGEKSRSVSKILGRFCETMHVPKEQFLELSDSAEKSADPKDNRSDPKAPLKSVIEGTITDFLASSRAQDRIMLLFIGHAIEVGDEGYLVPIDGEKGNTDSLISVKWVYDALSKCKARQKILIMDVCRYDPTHGLERPGSGPLGEKLDGILQNPPAGVQVLSACSAGQYSYEGSVYLPSREVVQSGLFLNEIFEAIGPAKKKKVSLGIQRQDEPIPVDLLSKAGEEGKGLVPGTEFAAEDLYKAKQTPRLAGSEAPEGAAFDANEAAAARVVAKTPTPPPGGAAPIKVVRNVLDDINRIPPVKMSRGGVLPLKAETLRPFSTKILEKYQDEGESPLKKEVLAVVKLLSEERMQKTFMEKFTGQGDDGAIKKIILQQQRDPAVIMAELTEALEDLKKAGDQKKMATLLWQANYDYVLARLEARIAYVLEYNYMLGQIRKDALPPRDASKGYTGWRLASSEKLISGNEARNLAKDSKKILDKLAKDHAGTPYEILAKREAITTLGLEWQLTKE